MMHLHFSGLLEFVSVRANKHFLILLQKSSKTNIVLTEAKVQLSRHFLMHKIYTLCKNGLIFLFYNKNCRFNAVQNI